MYVNFPGWEKMCKRECMLSGGDLDAARTLWCRNPGYGDVLSNGQRANETSV